MTIRLPEPARDRRTEKELDRRYKEARLFLLRQCIPGEVYRPAPDDAKTALLFNQMSREGYFTEVLPERYTITPKGLEYRDRLRRSAWRQWTIDNAQWVFPTLVAVASTITAICAVILGIR